MKNKKFIEELKEIVNDGTILKSDSFDTRLAENVNAFYEDGKQKKMGVALLYRVFLL